MYINRITWMIRRLGVLCFLFFFLLSCNQNQQGSRSHPVVQAMQMQVTAIPIYKDYIGITQSISSVNIRARVQGFLIKKNFTEGQFVQKDRLIYVIDPRPFEAKLDLAKGQLAKSIAARDFQAVQYSRMKKLVAKGDVSESRYDEVNAQFHAAEAEVDIAKAQVEEAEINLSYCYMYSPIDGVSGVKHVDVGNLVGGAEETLLVTIARLSPLYIEFSPSVADFGELLQYRVNAPFEAEATLPHDPQVVLKGSVDLIDNQADTSTSTILMRATLKNPKKLILPGIYMNVRVILTHKGEALLLPSEAIFDTQGKQYVYIIGKNNQVESRSIRTAGQYGQQMIIKSGLKVGDWVIVQGLQKIRPGEEVTVDKRVAQKKIGSSEHSIQSGPWWERLDQTTLELADAWHL